MDTAITGVRLVSKIHAASEAFVSKLPRFAWPTASGNRRLPTSYAPADGLLVCAALWPAKAAREQITVVVPPGDERIATARFQAAAAKEIDGLNDRVTVRKVKKCDLPKDANVLNVRFVWTPDKCGTPEEAPKARFVSQGHHDQAKLFVVHNVEYVLTNKGYGTERRLEGKETAITIKAKKTDLELPDVRLGASRPSEGGEPPRRR